MAQTHLVHFREKGTKCPKCGGYLRSWVMSKSIFYICNDCGQHYKYDQDKTINFDAVKEKAYDDFRSWGFLEEIEKR